MTIASEENCIQLQEDLDAMQKWETSWKMEFNDTKCEVLLISKSKSPIQHMYYLHGMPLNPSSLKPFSQTYPLKGWGGGLGEGFRWTPPQDFCYARTDQLEIWHEC